jgi:hypothetical protein
MAAEIALRPNDDRGREILDMLEELADLEGRTEMRPTDILGDGTRRYHLDATDADASMPSIRSSTRSTGSGAIT